ncbi:hypothetical protein NQT62_08230 [Limnobacter humi]|uniref:Acetyl xylan esterase domain-containing protein n=1 Tax=Limnobacter humi TaxID=1778671 RepID=A0ABT1WFX4_9BURK|nr:hypothetical protein [Limnobacter humi]MCQ8896416.1 hypothetical protein [Limnobacter humi]
MPTFRPHLNIQIASTVVLLAALLTLAGCGGDSQSPSATRTTPANSAANGSQVNPANQNLKLDLSCDDAAYPSTLFAQCEATNVAHTLEANREQLNPAFLQQLQTQNQANLQNLLQRSMSDPSWILPPAFGNTGVTPLCAAGFGPCVGDPFRYPNVDGPDGKTFYEQEAEVLPVVYYDQGCARISGHVWRPRNSGGKRLPAIVVKNGSVQASEQLYWWAVQAFVRAGYVVLTNDPRGQGLSDASTPTGEQGGNFNGAVFFQGLVNDIDFLLSSPGKPYPHEATCKGTYPTKTASFNPFNANVDEDRIGIAGHSYGAGGVTWVQSYGAADSLPWPGLLTRLNPVKAVVAWDALGSRTAPNSATLTSLAPTGGASALPVQNPLTGPAGAPPVSARVPALGFTSEYGFTPVPFVRNPARDEHLGGFKQWSAANVPVMQVTIAGTTHLDYSPGPVLPASSWCPKIENNACVGGWAKPMMLHYTLAWMDRFLKNPGEPGYDSADQRLLDDAQWAQRMSFHFASARKFTTRDGLPIQSDDIRALYR